MIKQHHDRSHVAMTLAIAFSLVAPAFAKNGYVQHNLVSDIPGLADRTDTNLVNAWGLVHSASSPWWVNANGTGLSLVYDGNGAAFPAANPLVVTIPPPGVTGNSAPTGIVFNGTTDFQLAPGKASIFIFATEDGTISGWNPTVNPALSIIKVNKSPGAVYKGLALGVLGGKNVLFAANFRGGGVDVFDATFSPVALLSGAFMDATLPAGYAPFNVQTMDGMVFVAFAKQDATLHDDVAGPGRGYVDAFSPDGKLLMRLEHGSWLNSPWAIVMAPKSFGKVSGRLLVGNFGSGQIATYDAASGKFKGMVRGRKGKPITIDGLWGLGFGNDANAGSSTALYFTAGIQDEAHGLFGTLTPVSKDENGDDEGDDDNGQGDDEHEHGDS